MLVLWGIPLLISTHYVLFRTHLAKIKCFNLRAEDGLKVNVVLEAQPSALRNGEAIQGLNYVCTVC